jgi:flagellar biosynthetic protein FliR
VDFSPVARLGLLLVRPGVLIATSSVFGGTFAPPIVRVGVIVLVTLALAPTVPLPENVGGAGMAMVALRETLIGLALTFSIRIIVAGAEFAGHLTGFQLGFSYASVVDPQSGARNNVMSALYANIAMLVFLAINGHHQMLNALSASYHALPPGGSPAGGGDLASLVARTLGQVFVIGLRMALPVVLVLVIVEIGLGLVSRVAPQLNLMVMGAPVRILVGLFILGATLAVVPDVVLGAVDPALRLASRMAAALAGAR